MSLVSDAEDEIVQGPLVNTDPKAVHHMKHAVLSELVEACLESNITAGQIAGLTSWLHKHLAAAYSGIFAAAGPDYVWQ